MVKWILFLSVGTCAGGVWAWILCREPNNSPVDARPIMWLILTIPYIAGGFYTYLSPLVSAYLIWFLARTVKVHQTLQVYPTMGLLAVGLMFVGYSVSFLWAADHGMAVFGYLKALSIILYVLALQQLTRTQTKQLFRLLPLSGTAMTLLTGILQYIPQVSDAVSVAERLAGLFEYPNTFAAYLLICLIILDTEEIPLRGRWPMTAILVFGIFLSGSRTTFVLLAVTVFVLLLMNRRTIHVVPLAAVFLCCVILSVVMSQTQSMQAVGRYLTTSVQANTFLGRLLYMKDALPVIASHPFGLGYWGYASAQGEFQTGMYTVSFVHNGVLQLLLDVGWLPVSCFGITVCCTLFSKATGLRERLALLIFLAHCMFDFDLQFLSIWFVMLPMLELHGKKMYELRITKAAGLSLSAILMAAAIWLGMGELLYYTNQIDACLAVTPFHTGALTAKLTQVQEPEEIQQTAEKLLDLCPYSTIGHSALANVAFSRGDMETTMEECQLAIDCAKYIPAVYNDYCQKLLLAYQLYVSAGDYESALRCRDELCELSELLARRRAEADPIAWKIEDESQLDFAEEYKEAVAALIG